MTETARDPWPEKSILGRPKASQTGVGAKGRTSGASSAMKAATAARKKQEYEHAPDR